MGLHIQRIPAGHLLHGPWLGCELSALASVTPPQAAQIHTAQNNYGMYLFRLESF